MRPVTALWLIAVPLMDMVRVMSSRIRRGCSPFRPDREHLHHLLMRGGLTGRGALTVMVSCATMLAMIGIVSESMGIGDCWQLLAFIGLFFTFNAAINKSARFHRINSIKLSNQNENEVLADKF